MKQRTVALLEAIQDVVWQMAFMRELAENAGDKELQVC